ncbi:MAG: hypothetical protein WCF36_00955 [Candidatus Nanopelagicales bacterium]
MAGDEDIERLLREIDAMNAGGRVPAAQPTPELTGRSEGRAGVTGADGTKAVEAAPASRGTRIRWTGVSAVGGVAVGGLAGAVLPFIGAVPTGLGAALGAAAAGFVSGAPAWFHRR